MRHDSRFSLSDFVLRFVRRMGHQLARIPHRRRHDSPVVDLRRYIPDRASFSWTKGGLVHVLHLSEPAGMHAQGGFCC
jgi:hypothetical protein